MLDYAIAIAGGHRQDGLHELENQPSYLGMSQLSMMLVLAFAAPFEHLFLALI